MWYADDWDDGVDFFATECGVTVNTGLVCLHGDGAKATAPRAAEGLTTTWSAAMMQLPLEARRRHLARAREAEPLCDMTVSLATSVALDTAPDAVEQTEVGVRCRVERH